MLYVYKYIIYNNKKIFLSKIFLYDVFPSSYILELTLYFREKGIPPYLMSYNM